MREREREIENVGEYVSERVRVRVCVGVQVREREREREGSVFLCNTKMTINVLL